MIAHPPIVNKADVGISEPQPLVVTVRREMSANIDEKQNNLSHQGV